MIPSRKFLNIASLLVITILILLTFWDLPKTFFQQDEWQYFGSIIYSLASDNPFLNIILPFGGGLTHFFPFATLFFLFLYVFLKINFPLYAVVNLAIHLLNSFLVFSFLKSFSKWKVVAFMATLIFAVSSISHQAVSWVATVIGTLPGTFFLLISAIFFVKYLEKERYLRYFLISLFFLIISLLFKETAIFLFVFFPLAWFIQNFSKLKTKLPGGRKLIFGLLLLGFFYAVLRLFFLTFGVTSPQPEMGDVSRAPLTIYFYRLVSVPFRAISQSIFPAKMILGLSRIIVHLAYPKFITPDGSPDPYLVETLVADLISYALTVIIIFVSFFVLRFLIRKKQKDLAWGLIFLYVFLITSSLPFIFIPGKAGYFSLFEPRNLYIPAIGSCFILAVFAFSLASLISKRQNIINFLTILFLIPLLIFHIKTTRLDLMRLKKVSQLRESFLVTIQSRYPKLPEKVVFFTQSDVPYYGMPEEEKILPVQSGFGRMLMVWYQEEEKFPGCLYENQFLHDLLSQGFQYCQGRGFGYFRDYKKLVAALHENKIPLENVFAFSWSGKTEEFRNISQQIREKLKNEKI